jgi:parallel beta-helix repeat protein
MAKESKTMGFFTWFSGSARPATRASEKRSTFRPCVKLLESRDLLSAMSVAAMPILQVRQGDAHAKYQTIQSAVDVAAPGSKIEIFSGTYKEAVTVSTPGLILTGAPGARVVIQNPKALENGITVQGLGGKTLQGFTLANVTVRDFTNNGVFLSGVDHFVIEHVTAQNNGEYGLFPVLSSNGRIVGSTASGSNDTGIYVGQSNHVLVTGNVAYNNVNGIEIENSVNVTASYNTVFNNTVGILEDLLPGFPLPFEVSANNVIQNNVVFANNRPNTAAPTDIAALEMPGTGIAIVGGEHTVVQHNLVVGNAFAGIAVLSGNDFLALAPPGTPTYPDSVDPNPNDTLILGNTVVGNGFVSISVPPGFPHPADLVWTGSGMNNHWKHNVFFTSSPSHLP